MVWNSPVISDRARSEAITELGSLEKPEIRTSCIAERGHEPPEELHKHELVKTTVDGTEDSAPSCSAMSFLAQHYTPAPHIPLLSHPIPTHGDPH